GSPVFVAVLPAAAAEAAGADVNRLPSVVADRVGLQGTYAVVAGSSFRAGSTLLAAGQAGALATAAFQARSGDGVEAVLETFVDRVDEATARSGAGVRDGRGGGGSGAAGV